MRGLVALGSAVLMTTAGGVAAAATHHLAHHRTPYGFTDTVVNRQATAWSTVSRKAPGTWKEIDWYRTSRGSGAGSSFAPLTVAAAGTVTVTVSLTVSGGPIDLRVYDNSRRNVAHPGTVRIDPGAGTSSASYTFVHRGPHFACGRHIGIEWRRATDAPATLHKADAVVHYKQDTSDHSGIGCG